VGKLQAAVEEEVGISGMDDAVLISHSALAVVNGKKFVVTAIVAGERLPEGVLQGLVLHWGCSEDQRGSWHSPPPGWHTIPPASTPSGGGVSRLPAFWVLVTALQAHAVSRRPSFPPPPNVHHPTAIQTAEFKNPA
jgi:hypothetical protein